MHHANHRHSADNRVQKTPVSRRSPGSCCSPSDRSVQETGETRAGWLASHVVTSRKLYSRLRKDGASGFCQTLRAAACTDRPSVEGRLPWVRPHVSCPREMENIQDRRRPTTRSPNPNRASRCYYILFDVGTLCLFPSRTPVSPPRSGRASSPLGRRSRAGGLPFDIPAGTSCCCLQPACAGSNARM